MQESSKEIYIHHKNGEYYYIICECLIKDESIWKEGVVYSSLKSANLYVRTKENFMSKFKLAPEITLDSDSVNDDSVVDFKKSDNYIIALNNAIQADLDLL